MIYLKLNSIDLAKEICSNDIYNNAFYIDRI